jgi:hypothetical protein
MAFANHSARSRKALAWDLRFTSAPASKFTEDQNMERDEYSGATLGELMFALTEETERLVQNKIDAHVLAAYILSDLFGQSAKRSETWH